MAIEGASAVLSSVPAMQNKCFLVRISILPFETAGEASTPSPRELTEMTLAFGLLMRTLEVSMTYVSPFSLVQ